MPGASIPVQIAAISRAAEDVIVLELRDPRGAELPAFEAGAHVDLHLTGQLVRSYSLANDPAERDRYVVAVHRAPAGRGGSAHVHDRLCVGAALTISAPRNHFPLIESASHSVLIAGGIGITPLYAMIQRLQAIGASWTLHYCARTRQHAAFAEALERHGDRVRFNFDREPGGALLDIAAVMRTAPPGTHFYCCGPQPMLSAFTAAAATLPAQCVHLEYFSASGIASSPTGEFTVVLDKSGIEFRVGPDETILGKLLELEFDLPYSCQEGVCGSCEVNVIGGTPEHRDLVLSKEEQTAGRSMMVCCSRCLGDKLVLDL